MIYLLLLVYFSCTAVYYSIWALIKYNLPLYFKSVVFFVFFLSLYGIHLLFVGDDVYWQAGASYIPQNRYLLWLTTSLLSFIPVYVFTCEGIIGNREIKFLFFVMMISCAYVFNGSYQFQLKNAVMMGNDRDEFAITCVYSFLSILPLLVLFKKRMVLTFSLMCVIFIFCVLGAKRGPIILVGLCSFFVIFSMFSFYDIKKKILLFLVTLLCFWGLYEFVVYQMQSSSYFSLRIEQTMEGYTSGRDEYLRNILDYFINSTTTKQFFGGIGAQGTLSINESYAHNDWVGILLEQGIIGLLLYSFYWVSFVITWLKSKHEIDSFIGIGMLIVVGLGKTMFSMYYLPVTPEMVTSSGFYAIALGFFLAKAYPQHTL